jgi:predicted transcriptional regulator
MNLLQIIEKHTSVKSGISVIQLANLAGMSISNTKTALKELHRAGQIRVREGINHKLIFPV